MTVTYIIQLQDSSLPSALLISLALLCSSISFCRKLVKLNSYYLYYLNIAWPEFLFKINGMWTV